MPSRHVLCLSFVLISLATLSANRAYAFESAIAVDDLDPAAFAQWLDGREQPLDVKSGPRHVIWTKQSAVEWNGVTFGESKVPGARHLRIGFKSPTRVGSVLVRAGGQLSVLKPTAAYPGDLADESQWIPAERLKQREVTSAAVGREEYALWVLPPQTQTRALRFTHTAVAADKTYAGWLGGVFVLSDRLANVAPQAFAVTARNPQKARLLNNESNDGTWSTWENVAAREQDETADPAPVAQQPAELLLVWPRPVTLQGLNALWAGFGAAEVQAFAGPAERHPREALASDWQTIKSFDGIDSQYPRALGPNWLDFDRRVTTRALRLRLTKTTKESHPHMQGNTRDGRRVWLGELLAVTPLDQTPLSSAILPSAGDPQSHPPIPIRFTLSQAGFVTLVIDDTEGRRVRNLISETPFPAGQNVAWWDGLDDLGRDSEAARHGVYHVPGQFVRPGSYRVRGLFHPGIDLRYEFPIYTAGSPAWNTADSTGAWLSNHTPPSSALFVPADRAPGGQPLVYLGSFVSEGTHGLAWVDLDGRKVGGVNWVGGVWTGAPLLARDAGPKGVPDVIAYAGSIWEADKAKRQVEVRLTALTPRGDRPVIKHVYTLGDEAQGHDGQLDTEGEMGGLAARDGFLYMSLRRHGKVLVVDARKTTAESPGNQTSGQVVGTFPAAEPRGIAIDGEGQLVMLSGKKLVRQSLPQDRSRIDGLSAPQVIVADGLEDPQHVTLDDQGQLYVSDWGASHQVKVFSSQGRLVRAIGKPGAPPAGPYDPLHIHRPRGLTIDDRGRVWVAECDDQPKRVSVWTREGQLVKAFYGPAEYGGGGTLDPQDKSLFYYHGMQFKLDWQRGTDRLESVFYRPGLDTLALPPRCGFPEQPIYAHGRKYLANSFNSNPTNGAEIAFVWRLRDGLAVAAAALGRANNWELLKTDEFRSRWPEGVDLRGDYWRNQATCLWSDRNEDGRPQPDEVTILKASCGDVTVMPDLALVASRVDDVAVRCAPQSFTSQGVPVYDWNTRQSLAQDVQHPVSSGGDQALVHPDGWAVLTVAPKPYSPFSLCGVFRGQPRWSYPDMWPGLHASHEAPTPDRPGQLIGTTRLLGSFLTPPGSDAGPLWCINGNMGVMYLLTADGLFVHELFHDSRLGRPWSMPVAQRGMLLNDVTAHDENFWPSITQTADGQVYLMDGGRTSLVRVEGLSQIRRLPESSVAVSEQDLRAAQAWLLDREATRQQAFGREVLKVAIRPAPPTVDGRLDDWVGAEWATIDKRGVRAWFDSNSKPYDVSGAVAIANGRLYAAFRTGEKDLLRNSGEVAQTPFKTGGALDLMLGTNPQADPKRSQAVAGDLRLLVTRVKDQPLAVLYRAVVPGTADADRVPFSSPWRTIYLDRVDDITKQLEFAAAEGNFEFSVPLETLGLRAEPGTVLKGDLGVLRGDGTRTLHRVYWSNQATGITADVPSEALLTPHLWGRWELGR